MQSIRRRFLWIGVVCLLLILAALGLICRSGRRPDHTEEKEETMKPLKKTKLLLVPIALVLLAASTTFAFAAQGPPAPKAVSGHPVSAVAHGVPTPTSFAFASGRAFVAGFGDERNPKVKGGVYLLAGGRAVRVPGSPAHVVGL